MRRRGIARIAGYLLRALDGRILGASVLSVSILDDGRILGFSVLSGSILDDGRVLDVSSILDTSILSGGRVLDFSILTVGVLDVGYGNIGNVGYGDLLVQQLGTDEAQEVR